MSALVDPLILTGTTEGMAACRSAIVGGTQWLLHKSAIGALPSIRAAGLIPSDPGGGEPPSDIMSIFGEGCREILCLTPLGGKPMAINDSK